VISTSFYARQVRQAQHGGGEELGGLRASAFYLQRTAVQADRALLERIGLV
jgi:hypothetical protein